MNQEPTRPFETPAAIGIDPGLTSMGFCALSQKGESFYRTIGTDAKFGPIWERYIYTIKNLRKNIRPDDILFMEDYAYGVAKGSLPAMGEIGAIIKLTSLQITGVWPVIVTTQQIRQWLCGVANLPNHELTKEVLKRYHIDTKSKDIAIAYTLADLGYHYLKRTSGDDLGMSKQRLGILDKIASRNLQERSPGS